MTGRDQEADNLPLGKILLAAFVTLVVFGGGVAFSGAELAGRHLTTVPPPHTTVQYSLIGNTAPGLERGDAGDLDRFGWADRDAGVAVIPLDHAIDLTLQERK